MKLTKNEIVKELVKCGKDPQYFIDNYCKISHPMHGQIPFKTYDYQKDMLQSFNDYRFNVILKARQLGISTISAAYVVSPRKERSRYRNEANHSNKPCKESQDDLQKPSILDVDCEDCC